MRADTYFSLQEALKDDISKELRAAIEKEFERVKAIGTARLESEDAL